MDQSSSSVWEDWGDLLDFTVDPSDPFLLPTFPSPLLPPPPPSVVDETSPKVDKPMAGKVRKRDPRLVCENYLAGRVPCACPELDAMMLEQEDEEKEKRKRVRIRDGMKKDQVRCQVVGCEVDIGELKGYHKRHKVCLKCANAERVFMDGEEKRYCQQCGKFHILPDFDEGKRSCRRKLERHNRRRRRKPTDDTSLIEDKGPHHTNESAEATHDVERNDGTSKLSSHFA